MNTLSSSTFKSTLISLGLHASLVVLGSLAIYKAPMKSLELTGAGGRNTISLSSVTFVGKKATAVKTSIEKPTARTQIVATKASAIASVASSMQTSTEVGNGKGNGVGNGVGNGHDFDQGQLFSQIKIFFENRLGSTFNISTEQLVKIKITIGRDGEVLSADLVQGKLEFQVMKRILSAAKNIPLKGLWKSTAAFPQELIIPLVLTPS